MRLMVQEEEEEVGDRAGSPHPHLTPSIPEPAAAPLPICAASSSSSSYLLVTRGSSSTLTKSS